MLELPEKKYLRIDEVENYFSVTSRTVRLWIDHGKLEAVKVERGIRITSASVLAFPIPIFGKKIEQSMPVETTIEENIKKRKKT